MKYGQRDSDSVKELQERLNRVKLQGGQTLPITGNYLDETDEEVRLWQKQVCGDTPDPPKQSFLGPKQAAKMFPTPPYTIHSSSGTSTPPVDPKPPPPVVNVPEPGLRLPKSEWDPIEGKSGLRPFKPGGAKIVLHTTESSGKPNWHATKKGIPHITLDPDGPAWQHLDFNIAAYTLLGPDGIDNQSPNSDGGLTVQIEMIGFAKDTPNWSDARYVRLKEVLDWLCSNLGVPNEFPLLFIPSSSGATRVDWTTWVQVAGIIGHQHAPYNDHWDPGGINIERL